MHTFIILCRSVVIIGLVSQVRIENGTRNQIWQTSRRMVTFSPDRKEIKDVGIIVTFIMIFKFYPSLGHDNLKNPNQISKVKFLGAFMSIITPPLEYYFLQGQKLGENLRIHSCKDSFKIAEEIYYPIYTYTSNARESGDSRRILLENQNRFSHYFMNFCPCSRITYAKKSWYSPQKSWLLKKTLCFLIL